MKICSSYIARSSAPSWWDAIPDGVDATTVKIIGSLCSFVRLIRLIIRLISQIVRRTMASSPLLLMLHEQLQARMGGPRPSPRTPHCRRRSVRPGIFLAPPTPLQASKISPTHVPREYHCIIFLVDAQARWSGINLCRSTRAATDQTLQPLPPFSFFSSFLHWLRPRPSAPGPICPADPANALGLASLSHQP